ncbi:hypothetical protein K7J14_10745 [Treponema zuelzerae]|uniref:Uncharacterized protein n=1 Tax=Teretinema zuelzerae TaxID=156 RepID=A0AAE3EIN0_9SPIR|nr:hypothetical protein [Teretinema zuelzerae]MCD1655177.1 hypothetical protein [Teretinema zuelzerae]
MEPTNDAKDEISNNETETTTAMLTDMLKNNIGAVAFSSIFSILTIISAFSGTAEISGGQAIIFVILSLMLCPILGFIGFLIGEKLRDALHPDFVITSGFMSLLKEKVFWAIGPQVIGGFLGILIASGIIQLLVGIE